LIVIAVELLTNDRGGRDMARSRGADLARTTRTPLRRMRSHRRSTARNLAVTRAKIPPDNRLVEFLEQHLAEIKAAIRALTPETAPEIPDDTMLSGGEVSWGSRGSGRREP
jgi:hypothetical protein